MSVQITRDTVALLKRCLRTIWSGVKSSHADEAIAAYYGFRTHAALLSALPSATTSQTAEPSPQALMDRLETFGYHLPMVEFDRVLRFFHAELIGRINDNFRRMPAETANDNKP